MYVSWCEAEEESWLQCIQEQRGGLRNVFAQCEEKCLKSQNQQDCACNWSIYKQINCYAFAVLRHSDIEN